MAGDAKMAVSVLLNARDRLTGTVSKAKRTTGRLNDVVRRVGRNDGFQRLRRGISRTTRATQRLAGRVAKIGAGVAAGAAVATAAVARMTTSFAANADEAVKLADQVGVNVEKLQEYRFAADRMGVSAEKVDASFAVLSKRVGEAANGTGALVTQLKKSNPQLLEQLKHTNNAGQAMDLYLKAIAKAPNANRKAALASAGFSRANQDMVRITRDGIDNIDALRAKARELGVVISEKTARQAEAFDDKLTNLKSSLTGVKNILGAQLLPVFTSVFEQITTWVVHNQDAVRAWATHFAAALPGRLKALRKRFGELVEAVGTFIDKAKPVAKTVLAIADHFGRMNTAVAGVVALIAAPILAPLASLTASLFSLGGVLWSLSATAIPAVGSAISWLTAAVIANPIGATIAAIAGAALLVYKFWGPISGFAQRLWHGVADIVSNAYARVQETLGFDPLAPIRPLWAGLKQYIAGIMDAIHTILSGNVSGFKDLLLALNPLNILRPVFNQTAAWLSDIDWSGLGARLIATLVNGIKSAAGSVKDAVTGTISGAVDTVKNAGSAAIHGVADGVKSAGSAVTGAASRVMSGVRDYLPGSDAKRGPLRDLTKSGRALPTTFAGGMLRNQQAVVGAVDTIMKAANEPLKQRNVVPLRRAAGAEPARSASVHPESARHEPAPGGMPRRRSMLFDDARGGTARRRRTPVGRVEVSAPISIQMGNNATAQDVGNAVRGELTNNDMWRGIQDIPED